MASAWAERRLCGFLISSSRSKARGLAAAIYSRANQATAANSPKIASGMKSASVNSPVEAAANMAYTLISTIFLITIAPRICMTTATASIFLPAGSVKSWRHVVGIHVVHDREQHQRQGQEDHARETAFARQGLDLAHDAEAVADQLPDLVEDLRQVAARLPLQDHGRDEEPQIEVGHPLAHRPQAVVHAHAQVLFFEHAAELLADRVAHLAGHGVEAESPGFARSGARGPSFPRRRGAAC